MAEVLKNAMIHDMACRTVVDDFDHHSMLDCMAYDVIPRCSLALIRIDVTEGKDNSAPFSLWDTERRVKGKQGPWICINAK